MGQVGDELAIKSLGTDHFFSDPKHMQILFMVE